MKECSAILWKYIKIVNLLIIIIIIKLIYNNLSFNIINIQYFSLEKDIFIKSFVRVHIIEDLSTLKKKYIPTLKVKIKNSRLVRPPILL